MASITLAKVEYAPGTSMVENRHELHSVMFEPPQPGQSTGRHTRSELRDVRAHEWLGFQGNILTRIRTTLVSQEVISYADERESRSQSPFVGRSFIVAQIENVGVRAFTGEGAPALVADEQRILQEFGEAVGKDRGFLELFPTRELVLDECFPEIALAYSEEVESPTASISESTMRLSAIEESAEGPVAAFSYRYKVHEVNRDLTENIYVSGNLWVRSRDGMLVRESSESKSEFSEAGPHGARGTGKSQTWIDYVWSPPRRRPARGTKKITRRLLPV